MISYAQNREDVVLDRALHAPSGFYVDVGAASPSVASVTRHFYELGWSGINLEPLPTYADELRRDRPRDITIEAAAGSRSGTCTFHVVDSDPDLSTADERRIGELAAEAERTTELTVRMLTLDEVLAETGPTAIDFLKIDVEGGERDVLLGIDLAVWRPRVIVVEATVSNTQLRNHQKWEELLTGRGYLFASFDGINRFYAAAEEPELVELLGPANVLDDYVPASLQLINEELARLRGYIAHLEEEIRRRDERVEELARSLASGRTPDAADDPRDSPTPSG
jgi:FkbM family methyltransferase